MSLTATATATATATVVDLGADPDPVIRSSPGRLHQQYDVDSLTSTLDLRYVRDRSALVTAQVNNHGPRARTLGADWSGTLLRPEEEPVRSAPTLAAGANGVQVDFAKVRETFDYLTGGDERFEVHHGQPVSTRIDGDAYVTSLDEPVSVAAGASSSLAWTESFTFTTAERSEDARAVEAALADPTAAVTTSERRWQTMATKVTTSREERYRPLAVKAMQPLVTNWRSPAGRLTSGGITPSISYKWFAGGMWGWDTWKEAVAAAEFDGELGKSTTRSTFDHQITADSPTRPQDAGMVPDAVFYNDLTDGGGNWNERNTKPPMATAATWAVYLRTHDEAFLTEMYPELAAFNDWWYSNRDHDHDGIAEYGATVDPANDSPEEVRQAAAWESGMDNAPRFDADLGTSTLENRDASGALVGYSLDQESVDLNADLAADGHYLAKIAHHLGKKADARRFAARGVRAGDFVAGQMFDPQTGWFYDTAIDSGKRLVDRGPGIEGAVPLTAGVVSRGQAAGVRERLRDPADFNTFVPFPTVARSSAYFEPTAYWRGPVWLDQAGFALAGLYRYGYLDDARAAREKLLENADGMLGTAPIHENYDPLPGAPLNAPNFSWSASMVLSITEIS